MIIDKGLISVVHFIAGLVVLRTTTKDEYGIYVNLFSLLMLAVGFQNALITTPLAIQAPRKATGPQEYLFFKHAFWGQWLYWIPLTMVIVMTAAIARVLAVPFGQTLTVQLALLAAVAMYFIYEFGRNYWFIRNRAGNSLLQDMLYGLMLSAGMLFLALLKPQNMVAAAFLVMALAAGISGGLTILALHTCTTPATTPISLRSIVHATRELFMDGKWAFCGVVITWLQTTSYAWLLTLLAGPAETADVNAARQLLMPIALFTAAYPSYFRPRWARFHHANQQFRIEYESRITLTLILASITIASLVIELAHTSLIPFLFGPRYTNTIQYLPSLAIIMGLTVWTTNSSIKLQVISRFRQITLLNAFTCLLTIGSAYLVVPHHGAYGSLLALMLGQGLFAVLLWLQLRRA